MAYERFSADNAAMLLIDHQIGTIEWMHSAPKKDVIRNTLALAKTAKELGMPIILTNRMIQLWVLPERAGEPAGYKLYHPKGTELTRVYGGSIGQDETFDSHTLIDVGLLSAGEKVAVDGSFLAYVTRGSGHINGETVGDGYLVRGENLEFKAVEPTQLIVVHTD